MSEKQYDVLTGEELEGVTVEEAPVKEKTPENIDPLTGDTVECPVETAEEEVQDNVDPVTGEDTTAQPKHEEGGVLSALKGMVSFFTIIRIPVDMKEFDAMERRFWLVPIIGLLVGLVTFVSSVILYHLHMGLLVMAVFALAVPYLFSKFLHFDGLTDFGDGMICSSGDREKHVRALKDTLVGAGGVGVAIITIILTVMLYYQTAVCYYDSVPYPGVNICYLIAGPALIAEILVKNAQVAAAAFGEPGNGMASRQVGCTTMKSLALSTVISFVLTVGMVILLDRTLGVSEAFVLPSMGALIASIVIGWWMARTANRNFGFVNGDILGATNEISRVVILMVFIFVLEAM